MADFFINADTGNDSTGDGSSGNPWLTLLKAHGDASVSTGDRIICQDSVANYLYTDQTFTKGLTVKGENQRAIFDGGAAAKEWIINTANIFTFENMQIRNATGKNGAIIRVAADNSSTIVSACILNDLIGNTGNPAQGNVITAAGGSNKSMTLKNSLVFDIHNIPSGFFGVIGGRLTTDPTILVIGNTFFIDTTSDPISAVVFASNLTGGKVTVQNHIFVDPNAAPLTSVSIASSPTTDTTDIDHNCYFGTSDAGGVGSITLDPLFVDQLNENFNLRLGSPCINAGIS